MELQYATTLAHEMIDLLSPFCSRIEIAGSIRRKQSTIGDVEIVCVPHNTPVYDMFNVLIGQERSHGFINAVNSLKKVKGDPTGKYTQRIYKEEKVDIFMTTPEQFGNTMIVRTGSADFSHMLMKRVLKCGFEQRDGYLYDGDRIIPMFEEKDYFQVLNLPYIEPEDRDENSFKRLKQPA